MNNALSTLVELLRARAQHHPDRLAYRFLNDDGTEQFAVTYSELDRQARVVAAHLQAMNARGERALLLYPPGLEYITAFFGCMYAGVVAVPAYPPRLNRPDPRLQAIVTDSEATIGLTVSSILSNLERRFENEPAMAALRWLNTESLSSNVESNWRDPGVAADVLAFIQFTSGSTSAPKGVMLSHGNLMHNLEVIRQGFQINLRGSGVFWLPSYHDMGFIGGILEPMYVSGPSTLMSPAAFLQRPVRWLEAITRYRDTITGAPNFAFDLCVEKITPEQRETLDLSSLEILFCGAEPIRPKTLDRFADAFAPCGLKRTVFYPTYGLAEATLMASGGNGPAEPVVRAFRKSALEQHKVIEAAVGDENAQGMVSCGGSLFGTQIVIVNPDSMTRCAPDEIGEIWVSSPSVAQGYWNRPDSTEETFRARLADTGEGPFLRTGDLGFLHDRQLFVTGRLKDLIIIRGRNHYPQDIELTVEHSHPALEGALGAAFSVEAAGEERLVIVHEVNRQNRNPNVGEVTAAIRRAVAEAHEVQTYAIVLVKPLSAPKTSSGKIQRHVCKAAFLDGTLEVAGEWRALVGSQRPEVGGQRSEVGSQRSEVGSQRAEVGGQRSEVGGQKSEIRNQQSAIEHWLVTHIAARLGIAADDIDVTQPFTYYGLDSAVAVSMAGDLGEWLGRTLPPTLAWDYPTIELLAAYLADGGRQTIDDRPPPSVVRRRPFSDPIALVGLSCRFPRANSAEEFWNLLRDGVDAITEVPSDRWDAEAFYDSDVSKRGKMITRWGGFLDRVDLFDPAFFGISPREAARMDPQQRLLLEVAWEALENAGIAPDSLAGSETGVFVGISAYDYSRFQYDAPNHVDAYAGTGNAHSIAANRLSYILDLRGPSVAIDTACSSSLVAVHLACQSLRTGESDLVLAGGVNVILSPELTITFSQARMMAADGRCKTFDSRADGYVRGEGCGVVVLKRLSDALRDGDNVLAIIRGSAVNQDGRSNGLTAPNGLAQQAVIRRAMQMAGVSPSQLSYVEAHGTGTPLGDPIEVQSLRAVLDSDRDQSAASPSVGDGDKPLDDEPSVASPLVGDPCLLGSVKTNIGHLESAAGVAGLIKVVLSLIHEEIPPHLHLQKVNPYLPLEGSSLLISTERRAWPRANRPRIAGVSSFGFGGTNSHVIVEESPVDLSPRPPSLKGKGEMRPLHLLTLSAKTDRALKELARRYEIYLSDLTPPAPLPASGRGESAPPSPPASGGGRRGVGDEGGEADFCFTANTGRAHFPHRLAIVGGAGADFIRDLTAYAGGKPSASIVAGHAAKKTRPKIAFLFTGQGSQYVGMGRQLYETQPTFRAALDRCAEAWERLVAATAQPLLSVIFEESESKLLNETAYTQPALFALEYALCELWKSWGVEPDAVMGHSVGEYAAACAAGVMSLEDGLKLIAERGRLMQTLPRDGSMAAVFASADKVAAAIAPHRDRVSIAALNGPENTVISGAADAVASVLEQLKSDGISAQPLTVSHAFHSPLMEPMLDPFERAAGAMQFDAPRIPLVSNVTAQMMDSAPDATYWRRHVREAVQFAPSVKLLTDQGFDVFIEIGPAPVLIGMAQRFLSAGSAVWLPSLRQGQDDWRVILNSLANLYVRGVNIDWRGFDRDYPRRKVTLPTYPFERERYWLDFARIARPSTAAPEAAEAEEIAQEETESAELQTTARDSILAAPAADRLPMIQSYLQAQAAHVMGLDAERIDLAQPLNTLGMDSLMATQLKNAVESGLGVVLPIVNFLQGPSIADLAAQTLEQFTAPASAWERIESVATNEHPLSYNQQALWFLHQLAPEDISFNVAGAIRIRGSADIPALGRAFQKLIERHTTLRTTFAVSGGEPIAIVGDHTGRPYMPIGAIDATSWDDDQLHAHLSQSTRRAFDLEHGPLVRATLYTRSDQDRVMLLALDHLVTDFWSMAVLAQELIALYFAERAGTPITLPPLSIQYGDYVRWQRDLLNGPEGERLWQYWQKQLGGELPVLNLPNDRPRPPTQSYRSDAQILKLSASLADKLKSLGKTLGATLFTTLLAAFQTLLHRYSGQDDILVGSVTAGRSRSELAGLVGYFINPVALRADFSGYPTFAEFLAQARQTVLDAFDHQDYPPALLAERLQLARDPSRPPLFQTMFILQKAQTLDDQGLSAFALDMPGARMQLGDLVLESVPLGGQPDQFDLTLMMAEHDGGLAASLRYNTDLFDPATAARMLQHFEILLEAVAANPNQPVSALPLLTESERRQLLIEWNDTRADFPDVCVHQLIEAQAKRAPDAIAVEFENERLTYRELNQRANQLAHHLRALGVGPETLVGVCVERSLEMIVGLLGILKAGGAYVPLDPAFPKDRIAFMLQDAQVSVLLTQQRLLDDLPEHGATIVCLDTDWRTISESSKRSPASKAAPENLAYVIYTSGSTGKPKGVQIPHRAVVNFLHSMRERPGITEDDVLLAVTTLSFDIAALELFLPLTVGARVAIASRETAADPAQLIERLAQSGATVMQATPATWRMLIDAGWRGDDRLKILCGGESLPRALADQLLQRCASLWNMYGPTESTIWSTVYHVVETPCRGASTSIGRPIANTQTYILDSQMQPVPVGVVGELHIGGAGLARGYLNRPELTAERFILPPSSFILYKTGDLARYLPDGSIEFLGRADQQVKVRGFRIELGEIESTLARHESIKQAVVAAKADRLVAYVVSRNGTIDPADLRGFLKQTLPDYMIPSAFMTLDALPLTPNGKVDRKALPAPDGARPELSSRYAPPRTPLEAELAALCAEVLGLERVGIHDSFFDLGGHSLLATQLILRLREKYQVKIPLRSLFEQPTIAGLTAAIELAQSGDGHARLPLFGAMTVDELNAEAILDPSIAANRLVFDPRREPTRVFLTGATGFVGAFLLNDLLRETDADVVCLVRAADEEEAKKRIRRNLESYELWDESLNARIVPVVGDLAQPRLGLLPERFAELAESLDAIYHNGALVNFVYPYQSHKAANVLGTHEVLRLASAAKIKPVHFVSTLSVLHTGGHDEGRVFKETDELDQVGAPFGGYAQSKWVAEKLIVQAGRRGIPVCIYRPGLVTGHSRTGAWNTDDMISSLARACIALGSLPDLDVMVNVVPVDYVTRAIVHLSRQPESLGKVFHLDNPHPLHFDEVFEWVEAMGFAVRRVPFAQWQAELADVAAHDPGNPAVAFLPLIEEVEEGQVFMPKFDCANTLAGLANSGVTCQPVGPELFSAYLSYLARSGFSEITAHPPTSSEPAGG